MGKRVILSLVTTLVTKAFYSIYALGSTSVPRLAHSVFDAIERCCTFSNERLFSVVIDRRRRQDMCILTISIDPK
jgi:hypothetical protein